MTKILSDKKVEFVLNYLENNEKHLPLEYTPNEMFHFNPKNEWDRWENDRYKQNLPSCGDRWNPLRSFVLRSIKLAQIRTINPQYKNKSDNNNKHEPKFIYYGNLLDYENLQERNFFNLYQSTENCDH